MNNINLGDKLFKPLIHNKTIVKRIDELAQEINIQFASREMEIIVVLDGALPFAKTLIPLLTFPHRSHYIRVKTYEGMQSSARFNMDAPWFESLHSKEVLILEDIIDSGFTIYQLTEKLTESKVKSIQLATLLLKPDQLKHPVSPDFTGFELGRDFVIGFGMDYNEEGRNLEDIYCCINP
jgi:hypoxanthine phosphoribosyltransferase